MTIAHDPNAIHEGAASLNRSVCRVRQKRVSNTILHNAVIVAQFLKRHGRSGVTRELSLPERITPLMNLQDL